MRSSYSHRSANFGKSALCVRNPSRLAPIAPVLAPRSAIYGDCSVSKKSVQEPRLETLGEREILSPTGTTWRVREALAIDVPGATSPTCLIFDSGKTCTRFWKYPAEWFQLSAQQLRVIMNAPRWKRDD